MTAISVVFVAKNKANSKRKQMSEKTKFKVDPRFAQIDSQTNITMNVSQISIGLTK